MPLWQGARSERPAGTAGAVVGVLEPKVIPVFLAKVNSSGTANTTDTVIARIRNPSRKLGCAFQVHFESKDQIAVNAFDGSPANLWTTRVYDPEGGHLLHFLQESVSIPRQYEVETFAPGFQISAVLGLPRDASSNVIPGQWVMRVRWEPVVPMCDDEVRALYGQCAAWVEVPGGPLAP